MLNYTRATYIPVGTDRYSLTKGHALSQLGGECLATLHHPPSSPRTVSYLSTLSSQRETHYTHKCRHRIAYHNHGTARARNAAKGQREWYLQLLGLREQQAHDLRYILSMPVLLVRAQSLLRVNHQRFRSIS